MSELVGFTAEQPEQLHEAFVGAFGEEQRPFFALASAPGRLELAGNHTDHQGGCVISAALAQRTVGFAAINNTDIVNVEMGEFGRVGIDLSGDLQPVEEEKGTSAALVRGMLAKAKKRGIVPGFDMVVSSEIPVGAGVSSSAAFEVMLGSIIGAIGSGCAVTDPDTDYVSAMEPLDLATEAVEVEHEYFGKGCGAQDQIASAFGGVVYIDFSPASPEQPIVMPVDLNFEKFQFTPLLIDSRLDHSAYNDQYDAVPGDMFAVAKYFGKERLVDVPREEFNDRYDEVVGALGELPALRAKHFFEETARIKKQKVALETREWKSFAQGMIACCNSQQQQLKNVTPVVDFDENTDEEFKKQINMPQKIVDICAKLLTGWGGWRVHGGGFGGHIMALCPNDIVKQFTDETNRRITDTMFPTGDNRVERAYIDHNGATAYIIPGTAFAPATEEASAQELEATGISGIPEKEPEEERFVPTSAVTRAQVLSDAAAYATHMAEVAAKKAAESNDPKAAYDARVAAIAAAQAARSATDGSVDVKVAKYDSKNQ